MEYDRSLFFNENNDAMKELEQACKAAMLERRSKGVITKRKLIKTSMRKREKVICDLERWIDQMDEDAPIVVCEALALLKESVPKEGKPLRCKTCGVRDKTGFCHRWSIEMKDDDYCSLGLWKER